MSWLQRLQAVNATSDIHTQILIFQQLTSYKDTFLCHLFLSSSCPSCISTKSKIAEIKLCLAEKAAQHFVDVNLGLKINNRKIKQVITYIHWEAFLLSAVWQEDKPGALDLMTKHVLIYTLVETVLWEQCISRTLR